MYSTLAEPESFVYNLVGCRLIATRNWQFLRPYGRWLYYRLFPNRRPEYFKAAWKYPYLRIGRDSLPACSGRVKGHKTFIFFPLVDWHTRVQRSQHLAKALADLGHICIYVNPHLGLEYENPPFFSPGAVLSTLTPGIYELHVQVPAEHTLGSRRLVRSEVDQLVNAVERVVWELGVSDAIQIVSTPSWLDVVTAVRATLGFSILYDCHDYLPGFERLAKRIIESEPLLLETCDRVVFSAQYLMDINLNRVPSACSRASLLRNANAPEDFIVAAKGKTPGSRSRAGYAGSLDHWFDVDLIRTSAMLNPDTDFVLAGRIEDNRIRRLRSCSNVRFTGEIPYASIPRFLHSCDVGLIPFRRIPLTLATNPIKLYEYFGAGLPVVSTRLPEVELYEDLVYIGDTREEFASLISGAIKEGDADRRDHRIAVARDETWRERAKILLHHASSSAKMTALA